MMSKEEQGELSESVLELRDQVDQLIKQGKIEEAMEIIKRREKTEGIEELRWRIVEIKCRNRKGEYEHVIETTEETIKVIEEIEEPVEEKGEKERIKIDALNEQVWALLRLGRQDEGLEKVEEGIRLIKELEEKEGEHKDKERIANLLNNKGNCYYQKGELDHALDYYKMSLVIREEIGDKLDIAASLNNLGIVYRMKGELGPALNKFKRSLSLKEEIDNKQSIAASLNNIGDLYQELGALEMALGFLKQGLALREEIGNKLEIAYSLYSLIIVTIDLEEFQQARDYLSTLQLINKQEENKRVDLCNRLAEALILKASKRRKNLAKAEEILDEIVENAEKEIISHRLTIQALINLSELLLEELLSTSEEEILEEVEEKVDKLMEIAKEQQSYSLLTESYWLKSQLALVRLDLEEARNLLIQAQVIAEEKGLEKLARKISSEHDQLLEQLDLWEELIAKDVSIAERVKVANLEELVGWMARKRETIIDEKEDKPIMLMLVSESGLPIYSKQFNPARELKDMLISGFLTSINTFVKEAFDAPGMIRRITHDEYTLSFNLIKPILFCYVYEGQSYTAMKKLDKLITEVYESEVWSALEEVGKKGYKLKNGEIAQMEGMMGEIFVSN